MDLLKISVTVTTIMQFLSGCPTCWNIYLRRHTGELSCLPFIAGTLNCAVWFKYSLFIEEFTMEVRTRIMC